MDQNLQPANNQKENKRIVSASPVPDSSSAPPAVSPAQSVLSTPPIPDSTSKPVINMNVQHSGQQFKLASAEMQGPKPPLVSGKNSKFALIAIASILIVIVCISGYYFYTKDNNPEPVNSPAAVFPAATSAADKNSDSDKDGLPDAIETVLGTYITKADSDSDGYSDLEEIKNGYSPLIAGGEGKYTAEEWGNVKGKIKIEGREFYEKELESVAVNSSFNCGVNTVVDVDNNIYNTVKIGEQCWLKENLKVTKNPAGEAITRYCYDNDSNICDTDGGLYDWNTAMNNSTTEGAQGICPNGWHVPKDSEWYVLESGLKDGENSCDSIRNENGCDAAGTKLKIGGISGFEGILVGYRSTNFLFNYRGSGVSFWSSTENGDSLSISRLLDSSYSAIGRFISYKAYGASVRCLKD